MARVSILLLTINRFNLTREFVGNALDQAGIEYDLCITDNGSTQPEIFDWCNSRNPKIYNKNETNLGTAQQLNRMIEQNPSDYYVFIGNDIELPKKWLKTFVEYGEAIPNSGVIGIDWMGRAREYDHQVINGKPVMLNPSIFGTMFISQTLRTKIGKFCEDYGPYGLWDGDYSLRAKLAGFTNYYISGLKSHHFGDDMGEQTAYRIMKNESIEKAIPIRNENVKRYEQGQWFI